MLVWLAALLLGGPAHAEATLSITPAEIVLSPGVPERVVVTLAGSAAELEDANLKILPPAGLRIGGYTPAPTANGTKGWIVTLTADSSLLASSAVVLVQTSAKLHHGEIKVSLAPAPAAAAQFTAELIYDGESLFDKAEGDLQLRLTNLSDSKLSITSRLLLPNFLATVCRKGPCPPLTVVVTLGPRATTVVAYRIAVNASDKYPLTSGKHQIAAIVAATRIEGARPWQGSQIVTREVTVGIPGLGEIQTLIEVPSFLLLPGFLICVVALMTWRWWRPPAAEAGKPAAWATVAMSPPLWVLAISVSMLVVWIYPVLSGLLGAGRRNLLQGFDLSDVIRVWVGSIITGFLAASFALAILKLWKWGQSLSTFAPNDSPALALRKMKRRRLKTLKFQIRNEPDTGRLFRILDAREEGKTWAFPAIRYAAKPGFREADFVSAADANRVGQVVAMIDQGLEQDTLALRWDDVPGASGPRLVDTAIFARHNQTGLIFDPE